MIGPTTLLPDQPSGVAVAAMQSPSRPPRSGVPKELFTVQALRFVAATMVVLFHTHQVIGERGASPSALQAYLFGFGAAGVHVFFCISGFIMFFITYSGDGRARNPKDFLLRRGIRLYPLYWIMCGLYLVYYQLVGERYDLSFGELVGALALVPGQSSLVIGPGWTLSYEIFFYLCFALVVKAGRVAALAILSAFFVLCSAAGFAFPAVKHLVHVLDPLLLEFVFGMVIGHALLARPDLLRRFHLPLLAAGVGLFALSLAYGYDRGPTLIMWGAPSAFLLAGAIGWEVARPGVPWVKTVGRWGDFSYTEYLVHILLIDATVLLVGGMLDLGAHAVLWTLAITVLICIASWAVHRLVEAPLLVALRPRPPARRSAV